MRDKLIEMISDAVVQSRYKELNGERLTPVEEAAVIADQLIAGGVILPPCKVGDDLYWIDPETKEIEVAEADIKAVCYYGNDEFRIICRDESSPEDIGTEWAMLTREEAERALKGAQNETN